MLKVFAFIFILPFLCAGFPLARRMLRKIMREHSPPDSATPTNPYAALIETPLRGPLAYTATDGSRMYVDTDRLVEAPNTLWNVLRHEYAHTQGQKHGDPTSEMQYHATVNPQGVVVDDSFRI